jgi:hypothetical protein
MPGPLHVVVVTVPQRDPAEHAIALDDPPIHTAVFTDGVRRHRIRLVGTAPGPVDS